MTKSVTISETQNKVQLLVKWKFAYRQARKSEYQKTYLDTLRFERRILQFENTAEKIFNEKHRHKIYMDRFITNNITT